MIHSRRELPGLIKKHKISVLSGALLGLAIFALAIYNFRWVTKDYATGEWKTYTSNVAFRYPETWKTGNCRDTSVFFELPGTLKGIYKTDSYPLKMIATANVQNCDEGIVKFKLDDENICNEPVSGERLSNGFYLEPLVHTESEDSYWIINVKQANCQDLFEFKITDPNDDVGASEILQYGGEPRVYARELFSSPQYQDIKRFAESIRPKQ